jgi:Thrombospondin type 1 domain
MFNSSHVSTPSARTTSQKYDSHSSQLTTVLMESTGIRTFAETSGNSQTRSTNPFETDQTTSHSRRVSSLTLSEGTTFPTHDTQTSRRTTVLMTSSVISSTADAFPGNQTQITNVLKTSRTTQSNHNITTVGLSTTVPTYDSQSSQQTMVFRNSTDMFSSFERNDTLGTTVFSRYVTLSNSSSTPAGTDMGTTVHQTKLASIPTVRATTTLAASSTNPNGTVAFPNERVTQTPTSSSVTKTLAGTITNHFSESSSSATYSTVSDNAGSWDLWSGWSTCTRTCDNGVRSRERNCRPNATCIGSNVTTETCLVSPCPGILNCLIINIIW